mmetsp:Transcript_2301/g.4563  ORF Transcript_2301/g.4563 Transcript_2301/m.4563 type:complete len:747 (-) Transcript_2301:170-2410(-)
MIIPFFLSLSLTVLIRTEAVVCPTAPVTMAGLDGAVRVMEAWKAAYGKHCPDAQIGAEGGGYAMGAARVCDNHIIYGGVDIGGMSGVFFDPQASTTDGWTFDCKRSQRSAVLLKVAKEGIAVEASSAGKKGMNGNDASDAASCIELMGGLTTDQLRWAYSSLGNRELKQSDWNTNAVPFSDGDDSTHLWSELNENCTASEVLIAGPDADSGAYNFFAKRLFKAPGETFRNGYFSSPDASVVDDYMQENRNAISFSKLYDIFSSKFAAKADRTQTISIMDKTGNFVPPIGKTFETGEYPLVRSVYMAVNKEPDSLKSTVPIFEFGFSEEGTNAIKEAGFWPIREWEKLVMFTRLQSELGLDANDIKDSCGTSHGVIQVAGSTTVEPVASMWAALFQLGCDVQIDVAGGGSSVGAARVCAKLEEGEPVDIGDMCRSWNIGVEVERREEDFIYDCLQGDPSRSVFQVDVALDGITFIVPRRGVAFDCLSMIGGLTFDQIRWIYSSFSEAELVQGGWDPSSVKNSDNDPSTHLWSELDSRCAPVEIHITGDKIGDGNYATLTKMIMPNMHSTGEHIAANRPEEYRQGQAFDQLMYLTQREDGISYTGFYYYHASNEIFWAVPIANAAGTVVTPSEETIGDGSYPLARSIQMNLLNNPNILEHTIPFVEFGLSHPELIFTSGYVPLPTQAIDTMLQRLRGAPYGDKPLVDDTDDDSLLSTVEFVLIGVGVLVLCLSMVAIFICRRGRTTKS